MRKYFNNILISGLPLFLLVSGSLTALPSNDMVIHESDLKTPVKARQVSNTAKGVDELSEKAKNAEIIKNIAKKNGIQPIDMLAMWHTESLTGDALVGDSGCSKGHFHINTCDYANPSAEPVIGDIRTEAQWVADRLNHFNYKEDRKMAIAKYNLPNGGNWSYYKRIEERKQYIEKYLDN